MICYKKLRVKMTEHELKWKDIKNILGISNDVITKINKDDYITLRSLEKFALYFKCDIGDLVEIKKESRK